jgi:hypothetical protein
VLHDPAWIQAITSIILALATIATLIVLLVYAADTKKMAKNSAEQLEVSQMPFLALVEQTDPGRLTRWVIQNLGLGTAVNIYYTAWRNPNLNAMNPSPPLGAKNKVPVSDNSGNIITSASGFVIEYESLAGKKFRTTFKQAGDKQTTVFEKL